MKSQIIQQQKIEDEVYNVNRAVELKNKLESKWFKTSSMKCAIIFLKFYIKSKNEFIEILEEKIK